MAEIHPNDIGLATFEDVGDVQKLLTVAKNIVAAINELYQNSSDIGDALGKQIYVDGENNVIIGQNNIVHGSNNLIVGSNNVVVGDNYSIFTDNYQRFGSPNGGYFYSYDTENNIAYYSMMEPDVDFDIPNGVNIAIQLSTTWYNEAFTDSISWTSDLQFGKIVEVNAGNTSLKIDGVNFVVEPPDSEHTVRYDLYIQSIIILDDKFKINETRNGSFVFGDGSASGNNSLAVGGYASGAKSFAVNRGSSSGNYSSAFNQSGASGDYAFSANDGNAYASNSTAINNGTADAPYSFASGVLTRVFGRGFKCVSFNENDQTAIIPSDSNTKELVGKKVFLLMYNKLNPIVFNEGEIVSVSGNKLFMKDFYFPKDGYNDYSYFPEKILYVVDTSTVYAKGSQASGFRSASSGNSSLAFGEFVQACANYAYIFGKHGSISEPCSISLANGTSMQNTQLVFKVLGDGSVHADAAYTTPCADYAEYFEWSDGNPDKEDRVGYFVKLEGEKIVKCGDFDTPLGIVSATPAIIGDSSKLHWKDKYLTDDFGRIKYHEVLIPEERDEEGNLIVDEHIETQPIINPDWDKNREYIPRSERPEWAPVGVLGKLVVYDDGTLKQGDICRPGEGGIAVKSITNGYPVLKRIAEDKVLVWFKE